MDEQEIRDKLAGLIWETSKNDEGTISAEGADKVANAVMARFYLTMKHYAKYVCACGNRDCKEI